jgi:2-polyprenyl-6-methoxyphenol hydroxylase-like FAD-dependent oxidoreductase
VAAAFRRFEDVRAPVTKSVTDEAWGIGSMHHVDMPVARVVRDAVLRATPRRVWAKRMNDRVLVTPFQTTALTNA